MSQPFLPMNLDQAASPWGRDMQNRVGTLEDSLARYMASQENAANATTSTLALLSGKVQLLNAIAAVQYAEWQDLNGITGFSGFYSTPVASVQINALTGRLEIGYGGSLNSGNGYFCYSVNGQNSGLIYDKATIQQNYAQRVAVSGGASFIGSGFNSVIVDVPPNDIYTVNVELYAESTMTYFFGAKISARVAP